VIQGEISEIASCEGATFADVANTRETHPAYFIALEQKYRQGFYQGALAVFQAWKHGCSVRQFTEWITTELYDWATYRPKDFSAPPLTPRPWRKLRAEVLKRDKRRCFYCGSKATHVDHIVPVKQGGSYDVDNLVAACANCNLSKNATDWRSWLRKQEFWSRELEQKVERQLKGKR